MGHISKRKLTFINFFRKKSVFFSNSKMKLLALLLGVAYGATECRMGSTGYSTTSSTSSLNTMVCETGEICQVKMIKRMDLNEDVVHQKTANCVMADACIADASQNANTCRFQLYARGFMAHAMDVVLVIFVPVTILVRKLVIPSTE